MSDTNYGAQQSTTIREQDLSVDSRLQIPSPDGGDKLSSTDETKKKNFPTVVDVTITVTPDDVPVYFRGQNRRKSETPNRQLDTGSPGAGVNYYGRGRRASGARLGSEERVRKISFGLGGVPRSGSWGNLPKEDSDDDSVDSLLVVTSRRFTVGPGTFVLGPTLMGYNRRQWLNLLVFAINDFCSAAVLSLQAPFYPHEAISKGASSVDWAAVFFVYELTLFIMFPVFGKLFGNTHCKFLFNTGVFVTSISLVIFGFLSQVDDLTSFIMLSFILRIVEGVGSAASTTAKYSIISVEFPNNAATTFASLEKFYFLGCIIAPPMGGLFINAAGFILPFTLFGLLLFGSGLFTLFVMPSAPPDLNSANELLNESFGGKIAGVCPILKIPSVSLGFYCILVASCGVGWLGVLLEPHISKWHYSAPVVASIFIISTGFYSISASCWSWFREKIDNSKYIMLIGALLIFAGFLLIGPGPMIPISKQPWLICVGLLIHGIGLGACIVSGYMLALHDTIENGFADNVSTFGLVSAIYTSVFSFGQMLGSSSAGILYESVGFRWGSSFILILQLILMLVVCGFIIYDIIVTKKEINPDSFLADFKDELDPLLLTHSNDDTIHEGQIFNPEISYQKYADLK